VTSARSQGDAPAATSGNGTDWSQRDLIHSPEFFERFPYGLALVGREGKVKNLNRLARDLLLSHHSHSVSTQWTCCELVCNRIGGTCLSERTADVGVALPEIRMDVTTRDSRAALWVTAAPLGSDSTELLFHLRPASPDDRRRKNVPSDSDDEAKPTAIQIFTLGRFRVESENEQLGGEWLQQRPGQLLKYLICERRSPVSNERVAEALWPDAGLREARGRSRYYAHILRQKLEPDRGKQAPSAFVVALRDGYRLNLKEIRIDADEFEHEARAGLTALLQQGAKAGVGHLENALRLYRDDFLPEDPYVEWALNERDRLRDLAGEAMRALVQAHLAADQLDAAANNARRLAEMEPLDSDVQRTLIEVCLRRGRRSEALRRYSVLRQRMLRSFGEEPDFKLSDLTS
jgi:DNA-binding SARP family transcriptional activator